MAVLDELLEHGRGALAVRAVVFDDDLETYLVQDPVGVDLVLREFDRVPLGRAGHCRRSGQRDGGANTSDATARFTCALRTRTSIARRLRARRRGRRGIAGFRLWGGRRR